MAMKFFETELRYIENFSLRNTHMKGIDYFDDRLPDMYMHNFTFLESISELDEEIERLIFERKNSNKKFLRIETVLPIKNSLMEKLSIKPQKRVYDMMAIRADRFDDIDRVENVIIKRIETEEEYTALIDVDVKANAASMGEEVAKKRIKRKIEVYKDGIVECYGCFLNNELVGKCEFFINGDIAKIEDFDILPEHQRKGLGSTMVSFLMEEAFGRGIERIYLITDQGDTAKEMYGKCHFHKVAEKFEWFFEL